MALVSESCRHVLVLQKFLCRSALIKLEMQFTAQVSRRSALLQCFSCCRICHAHIFGSAANSCYSLQRVQLIATDGAEHAPAAIPYPTRRPSLGRVQETVPNKIWFLWSSSNSECNRGFASSKPRARLWRQTKLSCPASDTFRPAPVRRKSSAS